MAPRDLRRDELGGTKTKPSKKRNKSAVLLDDAASFGRGEECDVNAWSPGLSCVAACKLGRPPARHAPEENGERRDYCAQRNEC